MDWSVCAGCGRPRDPARPTCPVCGRPGPPGAADASPWARDWAWIYAELWRDPNAAIAWAALEEAVGRWARRDLADHGAAVVADAVADVCATVVVHLARARGAETFGGFVYGHFLNARKRALRQARAVAPLDEGLPAPEAADGPTADELALLRRCLEELPARERRAVELRYFEDAPASRIAAALGVTDGNARRVVFNGLARLRACAARAWPAGRG
jgi:RNA polymerase sigma factor (sigma-70 family)